MLNHAMSTGVGIGLFVIIIWLFVIALIILSLVGVIWAIIDIIKAKNDEGNWKVIWILVVVFLGILGVGIYYFVGRKDRIAPKEEKHHLRK